MCFGTAISALDGVAAQQTCPQYPECVRIPNFSVAPIQNALRALDSLIQNAVQTQNLPGVVVHVVYDQTDVFYKGYGRQNFTNPQSPPPTKDSFGLSVVLGVL